MNVIRVEPIHVDKLADIAGFAVSNVLKGEKAQILLRGYFDSDGPEFHDYIRKILSIFIPKPFFTENINTFLIIRHEDSSGEIYLNNVPFSVAIITRRDIKAGELVSENDIADISKIHFENISIKSNDKIVFCFRRAWKFGLFFDFTQKINLDIIENELGDYFRQLSYKALFELLLNKDETYRLFIDGWFPFIELLPKDFDRLSSFYQEDEERRKQFVKSFVDSFDIRRIEKIALKWWTKKLFADKKPIIQSGIEAYLQKDESGYISCIKTLYSEIEGIIRISYYAEKGRDPNFQDLKDYLLEKARNKFSAKSSLGFPQQFYHYLGDVFLANFDLSTGKLNLSRHTASHGVAAPGEYTEERALQGILILDQIYYYL